MNCEVIAAMNDALESGIAAALVILTESGRDTPGIPGALMAVCADGRRIGSIGGGAVEAKVISDCERMLAGGSDSPVPFDYSLQAEGGLGMVCGGEMRGLITVVRPARRLIIFGGGHVGQKIYEAGLVAGFQVVLVEDREEYAVHFPRAKVVLTDCFGDAAERMRLDSSCYVVIVTRGHQQDYDVLSRVAGQGAAYVGMIGSRGKVAGLLEQLRQQGKDPAAVDSIFSPIGLDIDDGTPGEIALGVLAEILAVKNKAELCHRKERRRRG